MSIPLGCNYIPNGPRSTGWRRNLGIATLHYSRKGIESGIPYTGTGKSAFCSTNVISLLFRLGRRESELTELIRRFSRGEEEKELLVVFVIRDLLEALTIGKDQVEIPFLQYFPQMIQHLCVRQLGRNDGGDSESNELLNNSRDDCLSPGLFLRRPFARKRFDFRERWR